MVHLHCRRSLQRAGDFFLASNERQERKELTFLAPA